MLGALYQNPVRFTAACAVAVLFFHNGLAQEKFPDLNMSVSAENVRLEELLSTIAEKSGIPFSFNPRKIPVQKKVTYHASDRKLHEILTDISGANGLTFEFIESQIVLKLDKQAARSQQLMVTLSGTIGDAGTGEALIGATVFARELQTGTITNPFGFFSLTIPPGTYTVSFSFVGYNDVTRTITLDASHREEIGLREATPLLEEIVVSSIPTMSQQMLTGSNDIKPSSVENRPEIFGEVDVVKSLESIPGVKFHSDGSTFYYVRGGNRDQNVVFIDDAPIYNPSHMLGMFSTIIPDAVNDITLYKGDMPASLGGRLSSVLDVRTKKGNDQQFSAWGNIGLISTKVGIEGPFKKNVSSYLFSARVSSFGWFVKRANVNIQKFSFHDLTGKVNFTLNSNNRVFFSFYSGADNYFGKNNGISWSNNAATLQWNHLFGARLFLNTTIAGGGYDYFLHTNLETDTRWNSHISNFNVKTDVSYFIRPENELTFGIGLNGYAFNPGILKSTLDVSAIPSVSVRNAAEIVLYGNHGIRLNEKWGINYGVRASSWSNLGEAFEFRFDENGNPADTLVFQAGRGYKRFLNVEPRITISYFANHRSSIKAGFARNVQNIHLISNSTSPFTSLDVWLPSSFNIAPQSSHQVSLGYYHNLSSNAIAFSMESFYKRMWNQIDYEPHAQLLLNPVLESELEFGAATSYGVEVLAKKDEGRLRGWIGYTWSRAKREFPDINSGFEYNAFYDRPHQINITASCAVSVRWQISSNWNYSTGAPYSVPVGFYSFNGREVPVYGQKNNQRLPDYHRLDLSATYRLNRNSENRFVHHLSFSFFNLYGRKNPLFVNFNKTETADGSLKIPANLNESQRVTSQFYLYRFTPSVSYNFKFL